MIFTPPSPGGGTGQAYALRAASARLTFDRAHPIARAFFDGPTPVRAVSWGLEDIDLHRKSFPFSVEPEMIF